MAILHRQNAYWDVRTNPSSAEDLEMVGVEAFKNSVYNLFKTPYGDRGGFGRPDWGNKLHLMLQEPMNVRNAALMRIYIFEDVRMMLAGVQLDPSNTSVTVDTRSSRPGYIIVLGVLSIPLYNKPFNFQFRLSKVV